MSDEKREDQGAATLYSSEERFNGQALSLGQIVLVDNGHDLARPPVIPAMIQVIEPETEEEPGHVITSEGKFLFKDFVADPNTAKNDKGRVLVTLPGDGWCWPPRV